MRNHQSVEEKSRQKSSSDTDDSGEDFLPDEHPSDMPFFHSEDIVKSQFFFAPLDQKTVGIKQKNYGKQRDDDNTQPQDSPHILPRSQGIVGKNAAHIEKHRRRCHTSQQERDIKFSVFPDIAQRQTQIKIILHNRSPPVASTVSVSEIS